MSDSKSKVTHIGKFVKTCLDHSQDLLNSAKLLLEDNKGNIAFHLAALSLEEIGKASMALCGLSNLISENKSTLLDKRSEEHVYKLFCALWLPSYGSELITTKQIKSHQTIALVIHEKRLEGLYVEWDEGKIIKPKNKIKKGDVRTLIKVAESRLNLEKIYKLQEPTPKQKGNFQWFYNASKDDEKSKLIFGKKFQEKLIELKDVKKWIAWLRKQFEDAEKESRKLAEKEIARTQSTEKEMVEPKWEYKIRIFSPSHSIRQKTLNWFNNLNAPIKLFLAKQGRKQELIVKFSLPKDITIHRLWGTAWEYSKRFVLALNIATNGFFWWQIPKDVSRFYEEMTDIENNCRMGIERTPKLEINFGNLVLEERDLRKTAQILWCLPKANDKKGTETFRYYLTALSLWGKNDIHYQFEPSIFMNFFQSLRSGMKYFGDWKNKEPFERAAERFFSQYKEKFSDYLDYIKLAFEIEKHQKSSRPITLEEVGIIKIMCDIYFQTMFNKIADKKIKKKIN